MMVNAIVSYNYTVTYWRWDSDVLFVVRRSIVAAFLVLLRGVVEMKAMRAIDAAAVFVGLCE